MWSCDFCNKPIYNPLVDEYLVRERDGTTCHTECYLNAPFPKERYVHPEDLVRELNFHPVANHIGLDVLVHDKQKLQTLKSRSTELLSKLISSYGEIVKGTMVYTYLISVLKGIESGYCEEYLYTAINELYEKFGKVAQVN